MRNNPRRVVEIWKTMRKWEKHYNGSTRGKEMESNK